jgi:hypothetical protein
MHAPPIGEQMPQLSLQQNSASVHTWSPQGSPVWGSCSRRNAPENAEVGGRIQRPGAP